MESKEGTGIVLFSCFLWLLDYGRFEIIVACFHSSEAVSVTLVCNAGLSAHKPWI